MPAAMIQTIRSNVKPYVLTSVGANSFDADGFAAEAAGASATIDIVIQPAEFKDLRNVPEGQNTLQWIVMWSEVDLPEKHKVTYGGVIYTIQRTKFWDDGEFYKAMAVHVED